LSPTASTYLEGESSSSQWPQIQQFNQQSIW
jgi:hypothetical protein